MDQEGGFTYSNDAGQGVPNGFRNADGSIRFEKPIEKFLGRTLPSIAQLGIAGTTALVLTNLMTGGAGTLALLAGAGAAGYIGAVVRAAGFGVFASREKLAQRDFSDHEKLADVPDGDPVRKSILANIAEFTQKLEMSRLPLVRWKGDFYMAGAMRRDAAKITINDDEAHSINADENRAVIAHEMAHIKHMDSRVALHANGMKWAITSMLGVGSFGLAGLGLATLGAAVTGGFSVVAAALSTLPAAFGLALVGAGGLVASNMVEKAQSRYYEMIADRGSVLLTGQKHLASVLARDMVELKTFERSLPPKNMLSKAFASAVKTHPSDERRIKFINNFHSKHYGATTQASEAPPSQPPKNNAGGGLNR